jgi:antitoxin ParD1/3/4
VLSHNVVPIPCGSFMTRRISQSISLTPELNRFVQAQVTSGRYQTASEVIRDGLRLLQERTPDRTRPVTGFTIPVGDHDA